MGRACGGLCSSCQRMYDFQRGNLNFNLDQLKPKKTWDELFYKKITKGRLKGTIRGFPYLITPCWASRDLKVRVLQKFQKKTDIVLLGITYDEKHRIQTEKGKCENLRYPLIEWKWTSEKCRRYLKEKGLLNPLYLKFKRLGCWLCPKQPKRNLLILKRDYPDLWIKLKEYEKDCPHGFSPNYRLVDLESQTFLMPEKGD